MYFKSGCLPTDYLASSRSHRPLYHMVPRVISKYLLSETDCVVCLSGQYLFIEMMTSCHSLSLPWMKLDLHGLVLNWPSNKNIHTHFILISPVGHYSIKMITLKMQIEATDIVCVCS